MFEDYWAHAFEVDALIKAVFVRRLFAREKFAQLARERFVICAVALRGLAIGFHFSDKIAQRGLGLRAMFAVLVPIVRPQGKEDAHSNEDDLEKEVEERPLSAAEAHGRESLLKVKRVTKLQRESRIVGSRIEHPAWRMELGAWSRSFVRVFHGVETRTR